MYLLFVVIAWIIMGIRLTKREIWRRAYPTIQYFIICNLLYNFWYYPSLLWSYKAVTTNILNHTLIDTVFTFVIIPISIAVFFSHYPEQASALTRALYLVGWMFVYSIIEYIFYTKGMFVYRNHWNPYWSSFFNIILFSMLRLHYKRPFTAIVVSIPIIVILMCLFPPPFSSMK